MSVTVKTASSPKLLNAFIRFPEKLYKNNPCWVPPLLPDEIAGLSPRLQSAFEYCDASYFLAYRDGEIVGRVAAIINHRANRRWKGETLRFGWLDFIEDEEVLSALIDAASEWGMERGCTEIKGPWGFSDMDREGLVTEGFDRLCSITCAYNFPYYGPMLEKLGFVKDVDWIQYLVHVTPTLLDSYRMADIISRRYGVRLVTGISMAELGRRYGMKIFHLYNKAFAPLHEFAPLSDKQIQRYLNSYVPIMDKDFVSCVVNEDDVPVGFAFCVPSLAKAMKKSNGRMLPLGWARMLWALKHNDTLESLMIGILPEYQKKGVSVLLFKQIHENCLKRGIKRMILNPELEQNKAVQNLFLGNYETEVYTVRRAYVKPLPEREDDML